MLKETESQRVSQELPRIEESRPGIATEEEG
jgi:hypothetical protein